MNERIRKGWREFITTARSLLAWWWHELRECADELLVRIAPRWVTRTFVSLSPTSAKIWSLRGKGQEEVLTVSSDSEPWPVDLSWFGSTAVIENTRAEVGLAPDLVLVHHLTFPDTVERDLDQVVPLQLERELPMPPERVAYDWRVAKRLKRERRIVVEVLIVRREVIERVHERAHAWHLQLTRIGRGSDPGRITGNFSQTRRRRRASRFDPIETRLAISAAVLAAFWGMALGCQWAYERIKLRHAIVEVSTKAKRTDQLVKEVQSAAAPQAALAELMGAPDALDVLVGLTEQIPADSWAYDIELTAEYPAPPKIKLSAFTPTATMLVDLLRKSGQFEHVRLVQATSAGLGFGNRLQLTATWLMRGPRPKTAEATLPSARGATHDAG
jgi:hypothetical protein